jgi:2-C-methyl-D-erythritol 4-phosphate cytidylyltransferase / 2-C-methyl-D-erythritol 2,4-cyclodiphosphate synthase
MIGGERVGAILAAGGSGSRAGLAKQWLVLGGESVLRRSARALAACDLVDEIVAVVPPGDEARAAADLADLEKPARAVAGGAARADSVRNGLAALPGCAVVLVHDAARPFATPALARAVALAAAQDGAALAAVPSTDTVKRSTRPFDSAALRSGRTEGDSSVGGPNGTEEDSSAGGSNGTEGDSGAGGSNATEGDSAAPVAWEVAETVDRRSVWLAQTPQGFRASALRRAFEAAGPAAAQATDECALVERLGERVALVPGEPGNFKITTPDDVARARARVEAPFAMGVGYDVHPFAPGRRLVLGGVTFEGDGLLGHSDADICAHAIGDAILGAAGLGDLGRHFPDTDARWKGVSSLLLLREIVRKAGEAGWRVGNCDVTLAARRPRIAPKAEEMRARLAEALGVSPAQVNVKGTTGEGLGFVGRGEGIAAHAVALLVRAA